MLISSRHKRFLIKLLSGIIFVKLIKYICHSLANIRKIDLNSYDTLTDNITFPFLHVN
jgi:hypothetical protein